MAACGKRGIQKQASSSSHDSLEISQTARDSHIPTAPTTDSRMGKAKTRIENCWAVENWKSKSGIPTFPPPRQPTAARKKPFTEQKTGTVSDGPKRGHFYRGNTGDISNEA
jgi:hypothetical protein